MGNDGQRVNRWGAGVAGGTAAVWYALPDYVASKRRRALIKALLMAAGGGLYAWSVNAEVAPQGGGAEPPPADEVAARLPAWWLRLGTSSQVGIWMAIGTILVGGGVVQERLIFRSGERLARRGLSLPHTRIGLVLGALVALSARPARHVAVAQNLPR